MKHTVAALTIASVQALASTDPEVMNAYMEFVATHGKSFSSKSHMDTSLEKFKINHQRMTEHNAKDVPF